MGLSDGGTGDVVVAVVEKEEEKEKKKEKKKDNICYIKTKCGTNRDLLYSTGY